MSKKTPAVLFYAADYLVGVIGMTYEEQGRYMYLLCLQQQKGHIDIAAIMPDCPESVLDKFEQDEAGLWYNPRMQEEMEKRYKFVESRRHNASKLSTTSVDKNGQSVDNSASAKHMQSTSKAYAKHKQGHMDNDNDNDNKDDNTTKKDKGIKASIIIRQAEQGVPYEDLDEQIKSRVTKQTYEKMKGV